ncbi:Alpha/beta hydrolase fold-1 [Astrocystis sublimbata]|nr:Alpha/beta hydrolase fold-1 [Astrocystis sublimbata]
MSPSQTTLPTIAIIAGAWQNSEHYEPLRRALGARGYDTVCRSPPSVTLPHGDTDLEADAAFVHDEILLPIIEKGNEVIVLMHSFAGVYGGSGVKGLAKSVRAAEGKQGGIIALVYLACPCVPSGVSTLQLMGIGEELTPWVKLDNGLLTVPDPTPLLFHKLPAGEAAEWASMMRHQAIKPMQSIVTYAPFEDDAYKGHIAYITCRDDQMVHPPAQKKFIAVSGVEVTTELPTSHMPWLEEPDLTVETIINTAEKIRM